MAIGISQRQNPYQDKDKYLTWCIVVTYRVSNLIRVYRRYMSSSISINSELS